MGKPLPNVNAEMVTEVGHSVVLTQRVKVVFVVAREEGRREREEEEEEEEIGRGDGELVERTNEQPPPFLPPSVARKHRKQEKVPFSWLTAASKRRGREGERASKVGSVSYSPN